MFLILPYLPVSGSMTILGARLNLSSSWETWWRAMSILDLNIFQAKRMVMTCSQNAILKRSSVMACRCVSRRYSHVHTSLPFNTARHIGHLTSGSLLAFTDSSTAVYNRREWHSVHAKFPHWYPTVIVTLIWQMKQIIALESPILFVTINDRLCAQLSVYSTYVSWLLIYDVPGMLVSIGISLF